MDKSLVWENVGETTLGYVMEAGVGGGGSGGGGGANKGGAMGGFSSILGIGTVLQ